MAKRDLTHARDDRSILQFSDYMPKADQREEIWANIICNEINLKTGKEVTYENYGCGHDGKIITKAKDVNAKPDKKFIVDGKEYLIEIKSYDRSSGDPREMITMKVHSIEECIKYNAFIVIPALDVWSIFPLVSLKYVLGYAEPRIYKGFSPNDLSIRLSAMEISLMLSSDMIKMYNWSLESKNKIQKNWDKLFIKEKKNES